MTATPFPTTGYRLNRSCDRDHENLFVLITLLNYYARQKINFLPILTHIVNVSTNVIHPFFYLLKKKKNETNIHVDTCITYIKIEERNQFSSIDLIIFEIESDPVTG